MFWNKVHILTVKLGLFKLLLIFNVKPDLEIYNLLHYI